MKNFSTVLKQFADFKESETGSRKVTPSEIKQIREAFENDNRRQARTNSFREARNGTNFNRVIKEFSAYKKSETGNGIVTPSEIKMLKEGLNRRSVSGHSEFIETSREKPMTEFQKFVKDYSDFKFRESGSREVTLDEKISLRESFNAKKNKLNESISEKDTVASLVKEYSDFKESKTGDGTVTTSEIRKIREALNAVNNRSSSLKENTSKRIIASLKEAADYVRIGRRALKEADATIAADMATQAGAAVDAAADMAAPAAGQIDPMLAQKITDVKAAVDDLAAAAGVSAPVDFGADPNAGVPAMGDIPVDGTTAAPVAPVTESMKLKSFEAALKERIEARKRFLAESAKNPYEVKDHAGDFGADHTVIAGASYESNESQLKNVPTAKQLIAGSDKNVYRPGKDATFTPPKGAGVGVGAKRESLTDQDVDRYLEKLDFKKIFSQSNGVIDGPIA